MSEKLLRFFLHEIKVIRLICQKCGSVLEVPIDLLEKDSFPGLDCLVCKQMFQPTGDTSLKKLAEAYRSLVSTSRAMQVEFVIPEPTVVGPK